MVFMSFGFNIMPLFCVKQEEDHANQNHQVTIKSKLDRVNFFAQYLGDSSHTGNHKNTNQNQ